MTQPVGDERERDWADIEAADILAIAEKVPPYEKDSMWLAVDLEARIAAALRAARASPAPGLREAALEEAAKVCESIQAECAHTHVAGWEAGKAETRAARWCAQAIRALAAAPRTGASGGA